MHDDSLVVARCYLRDGKYLCQTLLVVRVTGICQGLLGFLQEVGRLVQDVLGAVDHGIPRRLLLKEDGK